MSPETAANGSPAPRAVRAVAGRGGRPLTIRDFLDQVLDRDAVQQLTLTARNVTKSPLLEIVADLREEIRLRPPGVESQRRLHLLISELYHHFDAADESLVRALRADVIAAYEAGRAGRSSAFDECTAPGPLTTDPPNRDEGKSPILRRSTKE
jgi:hypothetical protein